ncbi:hypothetical protein [Azospirillum largimobile]
MFYEIGIEDWKGGIQPGLVDGVDALLCRHGTADRVDGGRPVRGP